MAIGKLYNPTKTQNLTEPEVKGIDSRQKFRPSHLPKSDGKPHKGRYVAHALRAHLQLDKKVHDVYFKNLTDRHSEIIEKLSYGNDFKPPEDNGAKPQEPIEGADKKLHMFDENDNKKDWKNACLLFQAQIEKDKETYDGEGDITKEKDENKLPNADFKIDPKKFYDSILKDFDEGPLSNYGHVATGTQKQKNSPTKREEPASYVLKSARANLKKVSNIDWAKGGEKKIFNDLRKEDSKAGRNDQQQSDVTSQLKTDDKTKGTT